MEKRDSSAIVHAYLRAKRDVLRSVYANEIVLSKLAPASISESDFLRELAWVILSAGMAERTIRSKFCDISEAFLNWKSARSIAIGADECVANALRHFRHEGKIRAIARAAAQLNALPSFEAFRARVLQNPIGELRAFPYIGPITVFHIAKNIGIPFPKPDRHLSRLAQSTGYHSVTHFCEEIASFLGEDIRVVDSVLWRFATLHRDYRERFVLYAAPFSPQPLPN